MRPILHQLGLGLVTIAGMLAAAGSGAAWAALVLAYVGGYAMAQYDDGAKVQRACSPACSPTMRAIHAGSPASAASR